MIMVGSALGFGEPVRQCSWMRVRTDQNKLLSLRVGKHSSAAAAFERGPGRSGVPDLVHGDGD
jgi:hypothetical protein